MTMAKKTKFQIIKRICKIFIAIVVLGLLIVLGFFVKHNHTFEKSDMSKWLTLSEKQRVTTMNRVVESPENPELLIKCVTKIAQLPDSDKMEIRDAIAICYDGIKANSGHDKE